MIACCLTHANRMVRTRIENANIEDMPNNNLRRTHEAHQSLTRDKTIHIVKEHSLLKASTTTTTNPNRATESNVSDCNSLIRNKPTSPSSNTKSDHQNEKGNEDSNNHRLAHTRDDNEEKKAMFCKKS